MLLTCPKQIASEFTTDLWNKQDMTLIDRYISSAVVIHSLLGTLHGPESLKTIATTWLQGFPDMHVKVTHVMEEGGKVAVQWESFATHLGVFKGIEATGKSVKYSGVTFYEFKAGRVVSYRAYLDMDHLLNQIR